jgi:hypothetical protein
MLSLVVCQRGRSIREVGKVATPITDVRSKRRETLVVVEVECSNGTDYEY